MKKIVLVLALSLNISSVFANEMTTASWDFPSPNRIQISQNRVMLFCEANPTKCPSGLSHKKLGVGGKGGSGEGVVDSNSTTSANNISVVLAGNNSSVILNTTQDADDNSLSATTDTNATVDYDRDEVLNYTVK